MPSSPPRRQGGRPDQRNRDAQGSRQASAQGASRPAAPSQPSALALIPGVSRSGGTIAGGLFMGYTRVAAARYSFLLAIPAVIASGGLQVVKIAGGEGTGETGWGPIIVATVIAFVVGYAVIAWFMRYITTHTFTPFMIYRILLALGLFALLGTGTLAA